MPLSEARSESVVKARQFLFFDGGHFHKISRFSPRQFLDRKLSREIHKHLLSRPLDGANQLSSEVWQERIFPQQQPEILALSKGFCRRCNFCERFAVRNSRETNDKE